MSTASIDTSELEYLKSCRDKLRGIVEVLEGDKEDKVSTDEKLREIKKISKS